MAAGCAQDAAEHAGIEIAAEHGFSRRGSWRLPDKGDRRLLGGCDDRVAVGIEDDLEEPIIFSDNCFRNQKTVEEDCRIERYYRKKAQALENDGELQTPRSPRPRRDENKHAGGGSQEDSDAEEGGVDGHPHVHHHDMSFDEESGQHATVETGLGVPFAWKSPVRQTTAPKMNAVLRRISKPRMLPYYATEEYKALHYNPAMRPPVLDCAGLVPIIQSAISSSLLQRDMTDAVIVLSARGDENKLVFGEAGFTEELLNLVESPDMEVRCNAVQSLANLISSEQNRRYVPAPYPHVHTNSYTPTPTPTFTTPHARLGAGYGWRHCRHVCGNGLKVCGGDEGTYLRHTHTLTPIATHPHLNRTFTAHTCACKGACPHTRCCPLPPHAQPLG